MITITTMVASPTSTAGPVQAESPAAAIRCAIWASAVGEKHLINHYLSDAHEETVRFWSVRTTVERPRFSARSPEALGSLARKPTTTGDPVVWAL
jgi:hypothetical protein